MKKSIYTIILLLIAVAFDLEAQPEITAAQNQYILARAKSKVKTFTEYLELLARTNATEIESREFYKQTIYLSFSKEGGQTRIHNDLIPASFTGTISTETNLQLETYLNKIAEYYGDSLTITHRNLEASEVYYAANDNWYFVRITADRKLDGVFRFGNERVENKREHKVDFYVNAFLVNGQMKIGGIYSVQPHTGKEYTKARVTGEQVNSALPIGQPLKFQAATIREKYKRSKEYVVKWDGGLADDIVRLELVPRDTSKHKVKAYTPMLNSNSFSFIPTKGDKIGNYQFRLHNVSTGRYTQSGTFVIRRKVPLGVMVGAVAVVGGGVAAYYLLKPPPSGDIENPFTP